MGILAKACVTKTRNLNCLIGIIIVMAVIIHTGRGGGYGAQAGHELTVFLLLPPGAGTASICQNIILERLGSHCISQVGDKFFVEHLKSVCILDTLTTTSLELLTVLADADIQHSRVHAVSFRYTEAGIFGGIG